MSSLIKLTIISIAAFCFSSHATDMGFRYNGNACVNSSGTAGYNPSYFGQCGDLRHATISGLQLDNYDLSGSLFDSSNLEGSSFNSANLTAVSFDSADLSGVSMTNAALHGTIFTKANMRNAHLAGADIQKADFSGVDLTGQVFSTLTLTGSKFTGALLVGAALDSADLSGCDLSKANFSGANLQSAILDGANMTQATFDTADLTKASLQKVVGASVRFLGSLIRKANLQGATLTGANMRAAQMDQAMITNANLSGSDLRHAVLKNATLTGSNFSGVRIDKATVLPISLEDAEKMGMFLDTTTTLLVIYDANDAYLGKLLGGLQQSEVSVIVSPEDLSTFQGDLDLTNYNAVLVLNGSTYGTDIPSAGQQALVKYVQGGGTLIGTGALLYSQYEYGAFQQMNDLILFTYSSQSGEAPLINVVDGQAGHPVLTGITSPMQMQQMTFTEGTLKSFDANSPTVLMNDSKSKAPAVAVRDFGSGHVVALQMCGAGDESCSQDPTFQKLIINSTLWQ